VAYWIGSPLQIHCQLSGQSANQIARVCIGTEHNISNKISRPRCNKKAESLSAIADKGHMVK
jgi:hypothetical protein